MGTEGFHHESKENQKKSSISNQIEQQTLTLEQRAVGTHLHRRHSRLPSCGTDPRSPLRRGAAQDAPPLTAGMLRARRADAKEHHRQAAQWRRATTRVSARAGEWAGSGAAAFFPGHSWPPPRRFVRPGSPDSRQMRSDGRQGTTALSSRMRPKREREGRHAGLVWRPGRRLSGRRPERCARQAGWAGFVPGPH